MYTVILAGIICGVVAGLLKKGGLFIRLAIFFVMGVAGVLVVGYSVAFFVIDPLVEREWVLEGNKYNALVPFGHEQKFLQEGTNTVFFIEENKNGEYLAHNLYWGKNITWVKYENLPIYSKATPYYSVYRLKVKQGYEKWIFENPTFCYEFYTQ